MHRLKPYLSNLGGNGCIERPENHTKEEMDEVRLLLASIFQHCDLNEPLQTFYARPRSQFIPGLGGNNRLRDHMGEDEWEQETGKPAM